MAKNIIYLGTPEFAVYPLKALAQNSNYSIKAVITQIDKPSGRGHKLTPSPVKVCAEEQGLKVLQPKSLKKLKLIEDHANKKLSGSPLAEQINELGEIDAAIVVAYGNIIPRALFDYPEFGAINIHPSLLPRWRGAAPIQRAVFSGDKISGTSIMQIDEGLDSGGVFSSKELELSQDETSGSLHDKLALLSTDLLLETLPKILSGELKAKPQTEDGLTYAEKWGSEEQTIDWNEPAQVTERRIRACSPRPGAKTSLNGEPIKIFEAKIVGNQNYKQAEAGHIVELNKDELVVKTGSDDAFLSLKVMQFPAKKALAISEILKSAKIDTNSIFK